MNPYPSIIGLSGYARAGKDTVADILCSRYGFTRVAFADKVRELAQDIDPILDNNGTRLHSYLKWHGWEDSKAHPEVRHFLQTLGVAVRNTLGPFAWVQAAMNDRPPSPVVFSDVRFPNEADAILLKGGEVWRVTRPGTGPVNHHISESAMDDYPTIARHINNDGTLEDLEAML